MRPARSHADWLRALGECPAGSVICVRCRCGYFSAERRPGDLCQDRSHGGPVPCPGQLMSSADFRRVLLRYPAWEGRRS